MADFSIYEKFANEVFKIDKHVRFVGIVDGGITFTKMREGLESYLTPQETKEQINNAISTWEYRKKITDKLGEFQYSISIYKKLKRITIPYHENGLILVSTEPEGYHEVIAEAILQTKDWLLYD